MPSQPRVESCTDVFGYLIPEGIESSRVGLYSEMICTMPMAALVPLRVRSGRLESAVYAARSGLVQGLLVDPSLYDDVIKYLDVMGKSADWAGMVDTIYVDGRTGALAGDFCAIGAADSLVSPFVSGIDDPMALVYGSGWECRAALGAMRGKLSFATVVGEPDDWCDMVDIGCRLEFSGAADPGPFDIVSGDCPTIDRLSPNALVLPMCGEMPHARFEAMRLAMSMERFRKLPEVSVAEIAVAFEANVSVVAEKNQTAL